MVATGAASFRPRAIFRKAYREAPWGLLAVAIDDAFRPVRPGLQPPSYQLQEARLVRTEPMPPVIARSEAAALRIALRAAVDAWPDLWAGPPESPTWTISVPVGDWHVDDEDQRGG